MTIAKIVCNCMNLKDVKIIISGGVNGRGWIGDVTQMQLDISKLKKLGLRPKLSSEDAVKLASKELYNQLF